MKVALPGLTGFGVGYMVWLAVHQNKDTAHANQQLHSIFVFLFSPHRTWNAVASFLYAESNTNNRNVVEEGNRMKNKKKQRKNKKLHFTINK